jgi:hypothetical protein
MTQQVALADWLEELAVYGTARRFYDAETAQHLSQAINHLYLVKLATESPRHHIARIRRSDTVRRKCL